MARKPRVIEKPASWASVQERESEYTATRRTASEIANHVDVHGRPSNLFGLALSGGGIRAAAFSMGAIESLSQHDLLKHVDYLSSVSGGGFAASTLLTSTPSGDKIEMAPGVVSRMRRCASYLAPQGLFSRSGAALVVTYLFGLFLNLIYYVGLTGMFAAFWLWMISAPVEIAEFISVEILIVPLVAVLLWWCLPSQRHTNDEEVALERRRRERRGLYVIAGLWLLLLAYWSSHLGANVLWIQENNFVATHADSQLGFIKTAVVGLLGFVPALSQMVYGALRDPKSVRRFTPVAIQALAVLVLAAALMLHTGLWLLIRAQLALSPHGPFAHGFAADPDIADAGNASVYLFGAAAAVFVVSLVIRHFVAYEHVSLHFFFRDRIGEAFVLKREGADIDAAPNLHLDELADRVKSPYWIINATMNVTPDAGMRPDALRRAAPFEITPLYCGFGETYKETKYCYAESYRHTSLYAGGLAVSTATAISAAAIAPRMGFYTQGLLPVLMSMLNLRLGVRLPNPRRKRLLWDREPRSLRPSAHYSKDSRHCYLSDGGHFDNLGLYALLRRRCRFIIAIDAEADSDFAFGGLGAVSRLARADKRCNISLDVAHLRPDAAGVSSASCSVGRIVYGADPDDPTSHEEFGTIVYLKAGFVEGLPPDLIAYRAKHARFPHEGTGNQFFDEAQFEAYRRLGFELMERTLATHNAQQPFRGLSRLFVDMQDALAHTPAALGEMFQRSTERFIDLETTAMDGQVSAAYDLELYPHPQIPAADLHFILSQIQLMEQVYSGSHLDRNHTRPENAGWMRLFERYAASERFRSVWHDVGDIFGTAFHRFCELRLGLPVPHKSRQTGLITIAAPRLRGDSPLHWIYAPPAGRTVRYELRIERGGADGWGAAKTVTLAAAWYAAAANDFDGHVRLIVRAFDLSDQREIAIGETEIETYRDSLARMRATGKLVIGIHVDNGGSPFCYRDSDTTAQGFDIELGEELRSRLSSILGVDLDLQFVHANWPAILEQPVHHVVDFILASITQSDEREERYRIAFTREYYKSSTLLVTRASEPVSEFSSDTAQQSHLEAMRLGVQNSTLAAAYAASLGLTPRHVPTNAELVQLLDDGAVGGIICDEAQAAAFDDSYARVKLLAKYQDYCIAVASLNAELLTALNTQLDELDAAGWFARTFKEAKGAYERRFRPLVFQNSEGGRD